MNEPLTLTLCLEEDSILVSRAILDALDHPRQVQMLINEERQMLLLQACTVDAREAVVVPPDRPARVNDISTHAIKIWQHRAEHVLAGKHGVTSVYVLPVFFYANEIRPGFAQQIP